MTTVTATKTCKTDGCKRPYRAKGYCIVHFHKWRQGKMPKKPRYKTCGEEKCSKPLFKLGMCEPHYQAWAASRKGQAAPPEAAPAAALEETKTPGAEPTPIA